MLPNTLATMVESAVDFWCSTLHTSSAHLMPFSSPTAPITNLEAVVLASLTKLPRFCQRSDVEEGVVFVCANFTPISLLFVE